MGDNYTIQYTAHTAVITKTGSDGTVSQFQAPSADVADAMRSNMSTLYNDGEQGLQQHFLRQHTDPAFQDAWVPVPVPVPSAGIVVLTPTADAPTADAPTADAPTVVLQEPTVPVPVVSRSGAGPQHQPPVYTVPSMQGGAASALGPLGGSTVSGDQIDTAEDVAAGLGILVTGSALLTGLRMRRGGELLVAAGEADPLLGGLGETTMNPVQAAGEGTQETDGLLNTAGRAAQRATRPRPFRGVGRGLGLGLAGALGVGVVAVAVEGKEVHAESAAVEQKLPPNAEAAGMSHSDPGPVAREGVGGEAGDAAAEAIQPDEGETAQAQAGEQPDQGFGSSEVNTYLNDLRKRNAAGAIMDAIVGMPEYASIDDAIREKIDGATAGQVNAAIYDAERGSRVDMEPVSLAAVGPKDVLFGNQEPAEPRLSQRGRVTDYNEARWWSNRDEQTPVDLMPIESSFQLGRIAEKVWIAPPEKLRIERRNQMIEKLKGGKFIGMNTGEFEQMPLKSIPYDSNMYTYTLNGEEY